MNAFVVKNILLIIAISSEILFGVAQPSTAKSAHDSISKLTRYHLHSLNYPSFPRHGNSNIHDMKLADKSLDLDADELFRRGFSSYESGEYNDALDLFKKGIKRYESGGKDDASRGFILALYLALLHESQ